VQNAEEKRKEAQAAMEMAKDIMAKLYNEGKKMFPDLEKGQEVWLNTQNLKLDYVEIWLYSHSLLVTIT
jgi:hypothetical protein